MNSSNIRRERFTAFSIMVWTILTVDVLTLTILVVRLCHGRY